MAIASLGKLIAAPERFKIYVKLHGRMWYLWRAINHEGEALKNHVVHR
ncbi:DDE-type integrase/transposase/recombinase [Caenibius tardaugens]